MKKILVGVAIAVFLLSLFSCYSTSHTPSKKKLNWLSYSKGVKKAKKEKIPTLVFFNADWCYWCRKMMREFNKDKRILNYLDKNFSLILVNVDEERNLVIKYKVVGVPTLWFLEPDGKKISPLNEYPEADNFLDILKYVKEEHYKNITFQEYIKNIKEK